jgi:hypothetical protein
MTITTHPNIWLYPELISLVHKANHAIELEAGKRAATITVTWGLETSNVPTLHVLIVDSGSTQGPLAMSVRELGDLKAPFQKWCFFGQIVEPATELAPAAHKKTQV